MPAANEAKPRWEPQIEAKRLDLHQIHRTNSSWNLAEDPYRENANENQQFTRKKKTLYLQSKSAKSRS